jgi:hypothetical protein
MGKNSDDEWQLSISIATGSYPTPPLDLSKIEWPLLEAQEAFKASVRICASRSEPTVGLRIKLLQTERWNFCRST